VVERVHEDERHEVLGRLEEEGELLLLPHWSSSPLTVPAAAARCWLMRLTRSSVTQPVTPNAVVWYRPGRLSMAHSRICCGSASRSEALTASRFCTTFAICDAALKGAEPEAAVGAGMVQVDGCEVARRSVWSGDKGRCWGFEATHDTARG
jgi:hypothetical protein